MITTADVKDYFKALGFAEHYYTGLLDNKPDKALGFYSQRQSGAPVRAIGGNSTYSTIGVTLLIHWNTNAKQTELAANQIYNWLMNVKDISICGHTVYMLELLQPEPVDVGTDAKGVYERVIDFKIYYERK